MKIVATTASPELAAKLARALVEERLAACATILPTVESIYWWQGKMEQAGEALLLLKTAEERLEALEARLLELHEYEVPELVVLPVERAHEAYLAWVRASVGLDLMGPDSLDRDSLDRDPATQDSTG